jgi:hypothetical protein
MYVHLEFAHVICKGVDELFPFIVETIYLVNEKALCPSAEDSGVAVPLRLFGDDGPYFKKRSLTIISFGSFFPHQADTFLSRFLV